MFGSHVDNLYWGCQQPNALRVAFASQSMDQGSLSLPELERRRLDDFMTWKEATSNDQSRKLILKIPQSHKQNAYFQEQGKFRDKFFGLPS